MRKRDVFRGAGWFFSWLALAALTACGARTGLRVPELVASSDAADIVDAAVDACPPADPMCHAVNVQCSAAVTTRAGLTVSLEGHAQTVSPLTIVRETWALTASPAGSSVVLSTTSASPTMFTADSAGAFVVRYTATDSTGLSASCDVPVSVGATYRGTEFWAASTINSELVGGGVFNFAVAVGNANPDPVTVTVTGGALAAPMVFTVPANTTITQNLPWVVELSHNTVMINDSSIDCCDITCCGDGTNSCSISGGGDSSSSLVRGGAYRLVTSAPVSMYQFNALEYASFVLCRGATNSYTNDASLLLPTPALTGNYLVLSHNAMRGSGSFVTIAGTAETPTTVRVTLSTSITAGPGVAGAAAGTTQTYTLARGDVVQLVSTSVGDGMGMGNSFVSEDMTGTVIQSSAPVAVWAGVDCTNMSYPDGTEYACDHIEQQLFPTETWGRDVVVSQLQDRGRDEFYMLRILSRDDGNRIDFTPATAHASVTLNRGQFLELESTLDFEVTGTRPFLVGQYMEGQTTHHSNARYGDPAFVLEVPTPQYRREYSFVVPRTYSQSSLSVVLRAGATFTIDSNPPRGGALVPVLGTNWTVWRGPIDPGAHHVLTTDTAGLGLKVVGVAPYTSYTYPGGLDLTVQP